MSHDVFISHATDDRTRADDVCRCLEASGLRCWMAHRDVTPGSKWADSIVAAIASSRAFVLVFSARSAASEHVLRELNAAADARVPIVPVRIDATRPTGAIGYYVNTAHWLDATDGALESHAGRLCETLAGLVARAEPGPRPGPEAPGAPPPTPPKPPAAPRGKRRSRLALAAVAAVVLGGTALAGALWPRRGEEGRAPPARPDAEWARPAGGVLDAATGRPARVVRVVDEAEMVLVPAGTFDMGAVAGDADAEVDEKPARAVTLTRAYYLDVAEVSNEQFERFVRATGHTTAAEREGGYVADAEGRLVLQRGASWKAPGPGERAADWARRPVVLVTWDDAAAYARWARAELPTEAQFERALRAGRAGLVHPWEGAEPPARAGNFADESLRRSVPKDSVESIAGYDDGFAGLAPTRSFPPDGFGLHDLAGNVWEWCADGYAADAHRSSPAVDPRGNGGEARCVRGGGWRSPLRGLRCSDRNADVPGPYVTVGFRCARTLP